jgi:hypothetical protein
LISTDNVNSTDKDDNDCAYPLPINLHIVQQPPVSERNSDISAGGMLSIDHESECSTVEKFSLENTWGWMTA